MARHNQPTDHPGHLNEPSSCGHTTQPNPTQSILEGSFAKPSSATAAAFREAYFDPITEEHFANSLHTNAVGPYWLTFAFLPLLEKWKLATESGQIQGLSRPFAPQVVMTSSMNGWTKVCGC